MLERAVEEERAPAIARFIEDGVYVDDCVSAFPSITPVCAATIATGTAQDQHLIPNMNWYHRGEARYVEYGSSFAASRTFGIHRSLLDTIYNMNLAHLSPDVQTVFESLDDADVRTAGTTFLIYRGRHRHEIARETPITGLLNRTLFRHGVWGPRELFYADVFASRRTGCRSQLGLPGVRDQHTGCVGSYLVEHDLFDFLLFSLPDNDTHSHKTGPEGQVESIAGADRELQRLADAAGGMDAFLEAHAIIVMGDHSQVLIEDRISLGEAFAAWKVRRPVGPEDGAEIAVCPAQRSAGLYVIDEERRDELLPELVGTALETPGVDLVLSRDDGEAVITSAQGELRFAPDGPLADVRGGTLVGARRLRRARAAERPRRRVERRVPGRAGARVGGGDVSDLGRPAALGRARLRVHRLGRRRPRRRGIARLAAPLRLAGRAAVVWHRPRPARGAPTMDAARCCADGAPTLRALTLGTHFGH